MHPDPNSILFLWHQRTNEALRAAEESRQAQSRPRRDVATSRQSRRDRMAGSQRQAGRALLTLAAVAAAVTAAQALTTLGAEAASSELLAAWHAFGSAVFAGLFALVASAPERYPGVLELAILHKAALTVWALGSQAQDATRVVTADGFLTLVLLVAYLLLASHRSWRATHAIPA